MILSKEEVEELMRNPAPRLITVDMACGVKPPPNAEWKPLIGWHIPVEKDEASLRS